MVPELRNVRAIEPGVFNSGTACIYKEEFLKELFRVGEKALFYNVA